MGRERPGRKPVLAADGTIASFTDPETGATQANPFTGNVYIAWTTVDTAPAVSSNFNPNRVVAIASSDGGASFTGYEVFNDGGNFGSERNGSPQLVVSQGTADGRITAGQLTAIWDDFGTGAGAGTPFDIIESDRIRDGAVSATFGGGTGTPINDNATTQIPIDVSITDPRFTTLTDLDVQVALTHPNQDQVSIQLVPPTGSGLQPITLFGAGTLGGANMGVLNGNSLGTTFDDQATRNIFDNNNGNNANTAPYIGHYRPRTASLNGTYGGATPAQLNGQWTVVITDNTTNAGAVQSVRTLSLIFGAGMTSEGDRTVTNTIRVRGSDHRRRDDRLAGQPAGDRPGRRDRLGQHARLVQPVPGPALRRLHRPRIDNSFNPADNTDIFLADLRQRRGDLEPHQHPGQRRQRPARRLLRLAYAGPERPAPVPAAGGRRPVDRDAGDVLVRHPVRRGPGPGRPRSSAPASTAARPSAGRPSSTPGSRPSTPSSRRP